MPWAMALQSHVKNGDYNNLHSHKADRDMRSAFID